MFFKTDKFIYVNCNRAFFNYMYVCLKPKPNALFKKICF